MQRYVLGFALTYDKSVVLIKKNRPEWQAGKWNGVGGKSEDGELYIESMVREFHEETGMKTSESSWYKFASLTDDKTYEIACFYSIFEMDNLNVRTVTDEEIRIWSVDEVNKNIDGFSGCFFEKELSWLINLAWRNITSWENKTFCRARVNH